MMASNRAHLDITALCIMLEHETRPQFADRILNGIIRRNWNLSQCALCKSFVDNRCTSTSRTATNCIVEFEAQSAGNGEIECFDVDRLRLFECLSLYQYGAAQWKEQWLNEKIWNLLGRPPMDRINGDLDLGDNMVAVFRWNGQQFLMRNGIDEHCPFGSFDLLHSLCADSGHYHDAALSKLQSLKNKKSAELHFKYHAEKKALAILLLYAQDERPRITVSLKMCADCHSFFARMSSRYERTIQCTDRIGSHVFENGMCLLCGSK